MVTTPTLPLLLAAEDTANAQKCTAPISPSSLAHLASPREDQASCREERKKMVTRDHSRISRMSLIDNRIWQNGDRQPEASSLVNTLWVRGIDAVVAITHSSAS